MFSNLLGTSKEDKPADDEQSLTTILSTPQERSDLTLLIANSTESMRKMITDVFSAEQTDKNPSETLIDLSGDDTTENPNLETSDLDVEAAGRQRKEKEQRERELSEPKMQDLKRAALRYFDDWRDKVLQRVGEVVNSRETAKGQKHEARPQSSHRGAHRRLSSSLHKQDKGVSSALHELYPPVPTPLANLEEEKKVLILHSMILLLLSLEHYAAHSRILLLYLTSSLRLSIDLLTEDEAKVARSLLDAADQMSADEETKKKAEENASSRKWKVGLASVAGAAIIGVTGGLAAPLVAAGVGSVMGGIGLGATAAAGYLGTLAGSTVLVGKPIDVHGWTCLVTPVLLF